MAAVSDLKTLLTEAEPELTDGRFVFVSFPGARYGDLASLQPVAMIREREGLTMIIDLNTAEQAGMSADRVFRRISLGVHSGLDAVGLTAAVSGLLAEHGIPANVVAGYYHDHVFVPTELAERACELLNNMRGHHD